MSLIGKSLFALGGLPLLALTMSGIAASPGVTTTPGMTGPAGHHHPHKLRHPYLVPARIDDRGDADVTGALQRFINRVPNDATIDFQPHGRYRIDHTLHVTHRRRLTIDGQGATLFARTPGGRNRSQLRIKNGRDITIENLRVRGANPYAGLRAKAYVAAREAQHAFEILGTQRVLLTHVEASYTYGDLVYVGRSSDPRKARNVRITASRFKRSGRQGISITDARNVRVDHNRIWLVRRATVDMEPATRKWSVHDVSIDHNSVGRGRLLFIASAGQGVVNNISIESNHLYGRPLDMADLPPANVRRRDWTIKGNASSRRYGSPSGGALIFRRTDDVLVTDNSQALQLHRSMALVVATSSCFIHVRGNFSPGGTGKHVAPFSCAERSAPGPESTWGDREQPAPPRGP